MTRWLAGQDGLAIAVSDSADAGARPGPGAPLLFVHGFAHNRSVWDGVIARLAPGHRTLCMDLRGHGESDWSPPGAYALDDYADDLSRVLDALGIERATLVAHSLGGNAATLASAARPDRVAALALIDTGPSLSLAGMMQVGAGVADTLRSHPTRADYRASLDLSYPLAEAEALDRLAETGAVERADGRIEPRLDPAVLGDEHADAVDAEEIARLEAKLWSALERVTAPTLIVRGASSAMLPAAVAERMVDTIAGPARLDTVDRAGHSVMLDAPLELAARLEAFLAERATDRTAQPETAARWDPTAASQASVLSS